MRETVAGSGKWNDITVPLSGSSSCLPTEMSRLTVQKQQTKIRGQSASRLQSAGERKETMPTLLTRTLVVDVPLETAWHHLACVEVSGWGVPFFGRLFAAVCNRNLDTAIPHLIPEFNTLKQ